MSKKIRLFCFPFAGGSKYSYDYLLKAEIPHLEVLCFDYPGRGSRFQEAYYTNIDEVVEDVFNQVKDMMDRPYIIYGHSMGALVTYLLTRKIKEYRLNPPLKIFLSGRQGPSCKPRARKKYLLPRDEFFKEIEKYGGAPEELLKEESILDIFEPILRADFQATENYLHDKSVDLKLPMEVFYGDEESFNDLDVELWRKESTAQVNIHLLKGKHFFIFDEENKAFIIQKIRNFIVNSTALSFN